MNLTQYFSRLLSQLPKCLVFWYNYFFRIDSTMFQLNSSRHPAINMPATAGTIVLTKKNISYLEHLCTQPPPYKHNCTRARSASHTSLITASKIFRSIGLNVFLIFFYITKNVRFFDRACGHFQS